jgi:phosphopantothenoylcysteine decarboxylase / phosphopantothenate---cysteine ligase
MKYILGVTGSIASYKAYDIARGLIKQGHQVKVVLTNGALEFIKPDTFRYLGVEAVYLPTDDFFPENLSKQQTVLHVELAKWADKLIFAPLSASTMSRLSMGIANDLLVSLYLAFGKKPILMFPAMNTQMWEQPRIQQHVQNLSQLDNLFIINPVAGLLACGDIGAGKFPEVSAVIDLIETITPTLNKHKKVIITAGATAAPIDPVRYVTNPSSGRMGLAVARAFLKQGYQVSVLAGHACISEVENLQGHPQFTLYRTPTTALMKEAAVKLFPSADLYISTGAIADIEFEVADKKLKKESMGHSLPFHQAADILQEIIKLKRPHQKIVSFAAETETSREVFQEKMQRKPVDLMIGNKVSNGLLGSNEVQGFLKEAGSYFFITSKNISGPHDLKKDDIGIKLVNWIEGKEAW